MSASDNHDYSESTYIENYYAGMDEKEIRASIEDEGFHPIPITNTSGYEYHPHQHAETKLLAFLDGVMHVTTGDEKFTCTEGDRVIIASNPIHAAEVGEEGCHFFWAEKFM